jgi:hypothetical protein
MSMNYNIDWRDAAMKGVTNGLILWGTSMLFYGETGTILVGSVEMPSAVPIIGAGFGASLLSDIAHGYFFPMVGQDDKMKNAQSAITGLGVAGLTTAGVLKLATNLPNENLPQAFVLGALIFGASDYIYQNILSKKKQGIFF